MDRSAQPNPRTVEQLFRDYTGRRSGIIKALTSDIQEFYQLCDPASENLSLYGLPNGKWEVTLPVEEVPPEFPEPALGINFPRDGMDVNDWIAQIAAHSDAWLVAVSFYFGARYGFKKYDRNRLFDMINDLPTVYEVVTGRSKKLQQTEKYSNISMSNSKMGMLQPKLEPKLEPKVEDDDDLEEEEYNDDDEDEATLCGACGKNYASDEFWICCDICEKWFHGKCVKITPARAEHIKQYKCPGCSSKRARA
ncbi:PHD finger protein ALFIN-LIKE 4-like [Impatiens glandulifera]|uniref:PHD finger protein ALFIN-LIKE 4-like n=1 Tax=Impatiens glandulifera TaxID=253017 RepID=UPI001FB13093|nr:PHD finger protein ALFIN-LIKE 4-like [Impatiens glandulifera]XP_047307083.1 PHD finger protein ALFIN-LIKE 4-like [Impatiens glandulifera]XP_047307084.1 PHD finger protein ALFIN-LIKE 4-like [Impatiens glandulifera]XP_047307085.1 PHD finger protein ALFIN-LIKE 4-like [Impatiens glandulifera]XP_047307086.1 PHD finger protein ALFIN-LIKE 4-like [Impatiens glandulifera]